MDDLRERIRSGEGGLERLMRHLPGFAGYKDREERRQADQIQRTHMADALTRERDRLGDVSGILLTRPGGLQLNQDVDRVRSLFDRTIDRIRHASQGCSGFYDAVRIGEAELDRLYEYDLGMLSDIAAIGEAVTALGAAAQGGEGFAQRLQAVEGAIKALDQKVDERARIMTGVQ